MVVSFVRISEETYEFEVQVASVPGLDENTYVALGFSEDDMVGGQDRDS